MERKQKNCELHRMYRLRYCTPKPDEWSNISQAFVLIAREVCHYFCTQYPRSRRNKTKDSGSQLRGTSQRLA